MNQPVPQESETSPGDPGPHGGSIDLETVNVMQQAVLQRARDAEARGHWLPEMTPAQWMVSAVIAAILVAGILNVVDAGLTAFQKFAEAVSRPGSPDAAAPQADQPAPAADLNNPIAVMVVPVTPSSAPAPDSNQPQ